MFDAGHGGKDPGAIGEYFSGWGREVIVKVKEKACTLSIAKKCVDYINDQEYPIIPYMTREEDRYVYLSERCYKANKEEVDIFVSIHHNARPMQGKYGFEIETYHHKNSVIGMVIADIVQKNFIDYLPNEIELPVFDRGIKTAGFYVLNHTVMPAILVELGFLSDPEEARFLNTDVGRSVLAVGIIEGLMKYYSTWVDPRYYHVG